MKKIAVVDLGSNTFHLLIVNVADDQTFTIACRMRVFTALSDGGIDVIKDEKIIFGLETIRNFKQKIDEYNVSELRVIGTAVLRKASNRQFFIDAATAILKTEINIIHGQTEAEYIFKGIMMLPILRSGTHLIMDIGGGSTEFILVSDSQKLWSGSYTLGVGVLHNLFHNNEPIAKASLIDISNYIKEMVNDMYQILQEYNIEYLIGASGSFEVLQSMTCRDVDDNNISSISIEEFDNIYLKIIAADYEERAKLQGLPLERVKLIVVGIALKKIIADMVNPSKIIVSPYALKEGVLGDMIAEKRI